MDQSDADHLKLFDRFADRVPGLDLSEHDVAWTTLDDGHEVLLVDGAGIDGSNGSPTAPIPRRRDARPDRPRLRIAKRLLQPPCGEVDRP